MNQSDRLSCGKPLIGVMPLWDEKKDSIWMLPGYLDGLLEAGAIPFIFPFAFAVIVALPTAFPTTLPAVETVQIFLFDVVQVTFLLGPYTVAFS